jgi:hypothetical protein
LAIIVFISSGIVASEALQAETSVGTESGDAVKRVASSEMTLAILVKLRWSCWWANVES